MPARAASWMTGHGVCSRSSHSAATGRMTSVENSCSHFCSVTWSSVNARVKPVMSAPGVGVTCGNSGSGHGGASRRAGSHGRSLDEVLPADKSWLHGCRHLVRAHRARPRRLLRRGRRRLRRSGRAARARNRLARLAVGAGAVPAGRDLPRPGPGPAGTRPVGQAAGRLLPGRSRLRDPRPAGRPGPRPRLPGRALPGRRHRDAVRLPVPRAGRAARTRVLRRPRQGGQRLPARGDAARRRPRAPAARRPVGPPGGGLPGAAPAPGPRHRPHRPGGVPGRLRLAQRPRQP